MTIVSESMQKAIFDVDNDLYVTRVERDTDVEKATLAER